MRRERPVGRRHDDVEAVDLVELLGLRLRRARHAGQLLVLAEVVLEGDGRERLVLALDLDLLLRLHGLVQPVAPAAPRHQPAGELVDDHDLAVLDHVVDVALEERMRPQRLLDVVEQRHVHRVVQPAGARLQPMRQHLFGLGHAAFGQLHGLVLFVDQVVAGRFELVPFLGFHVALRHRAGRQLRDDPIDLVVEVVRLLGGAGNDQRRPRLVDEDAVHLVDDREVVPALDVVRELELHVVAQVVEAELIVRAVGDVAAVGDLPLGVVQFVLDDADRHAEEAVDAAHPLRVAPRQVVVDRDDVDALAVERVQVGGQRGDERLAFARLHLGDSPRVQHHAADQLHVEVAHVQRAPARFAHDGKGFGQQIVERRAGPYPRAEFGRLLPELRVAPLADRRFQIVDLRHGGAQALQLAVVLRADDFCEQRVDHAGHPRRWRNGRVRCA